ncbi:MULTISPECIES: Rieske (2Fe-2S) protein [unclassified Haladaptatus]|uniref:QcrA and Rieske domain-containing protein n=1 Tax=unclassified Haladaptatus TaxID=2622732 RepID=UPI00209C104D|nr:MULTISPECIES: Rieske (2Fe-2S) protein [unclassified Haladaptatus]MCO8244293.1 Rieske (2Fe-2S) protein [Haladaptatus sp. AB643]MCO8254083.1 Rieske (2Fe-2S) protein [Haladaptatus sp. AB618]
MTNDDSNKPTDGSNEENEVPDERKGKLVEREEGGYEYQPPEMSRRAVATWLAGIGGAAAVGSIAVSAVAALSDAGVGASRENVYVKGTHLVDENGKRIGIDTLKEGSGDEKVVLPEAEKGKPLETGDAPTLLVRFSESKYKKPTNIDGTVKGYVAYSMVCTHEGCLVSQREGDGFKCPCHNSVYDPLKGAEVTGGPAPRALPQLPLGVSKDGKLLVATGPFDGPIGPQ